jgi:hypothetical protein
MNVYEIIVTSALLEITESSVFIIAIRKTNWLAWRLISPTAACPGLIMSVYITFLNEIF